MSCFEAIKEAIKEGKLPKMSAAELGEMVTELDRIKALAEERGESFMAKAGEYIANERYEKLARVREQKETLLKLHAEGQRLADPKYKGQEHHGFIDLLLGGSLSTVKGGGFGAAQVAEARHAARMNGLYTTLKEAGLLRPAEGGLLDRRAAQEMWAMDNGQVGITKDPAALKLAKALRAVTDQILDEKVAAGSSVQRLKGRVAKTTHERQKLMDAGMDAWKERVYKLMDREATFGVASGEFVDRALSEMWNNIVTGELSPEVVGKGSNLAQRQALSRSLIFKDGEAWFDYNKEFGSGNLLETIQSESRQSSKQSALMARLGVNPELGLARLMKDTEKRLQDDPERLKLFLGQKREIQNAFQRAYGYPDTPGTSLEARIGQGARVIKSLGLTGGASISAISDVAFAASKIRSDFGGRNLFSEVGTQIATFMEQAGSKAKREAMAARLGIMLDDFGREVVERYGGDVHSAGTWSKAARAFQKVNFMKFIDEAAAVTGATRHAEELGALVGQSLEQLEPRAKIGLERHGFDAPKWELARKGLVQVEGRSLITPEAIRALPDEAVTAVIGDKFGGPVAKARAILKAKEDAISSLLSAYGEAANVASSRGTQRISHELLGGTVDDGGLGSFQRLIMQFKAPMLSNLRQSAASFMAHPENRPASLSEALKAKGDFSAVVQLFILSGLLGYAKISLKEAVAGRTPPDPTDPRIAARSFVAGGMAGIYGDTLFSELHRSMGASTLDMVAGPVVGSGAKMLDTFRKFQAGEADWKDVFNQGWDNVPGHNLFYAKAALDYHIADSIREYLSPGHRARAELRAMQTPGLLDKSQRYFMFQPTR